LIRNNTIKIALFYIVSTSFLLLNLWFVVKKDSLVINLIPLFLAFLLFMIFSFDKIIYFIVFFSPLSLPLREFIPSLNFDMYLPTEPFLFIVLIIFITKIVHEKKFDKKILVHPISLSIYIYLFWTLITCFTSTMPVISFKFLLTKIWFIVALYFIAAKIFYNKGKMDQYVWLYIIPFICVIFYSTFRHIGYGLWDKEAAHFVVSPFYNDHTSYGAALAMYLPFLTLFSFSRLYPAKLKFISLTILFIFLMGFILSYSRAAWVSVIVAILFWVIIKLKIRFKVIMLSTIFAFALFFTFKDKLFIQAESNSVESSSNLMEHVYSISNISSDASNLERINRWSCAIRMFKDKPVFGYGPGTYMFKYAPWQLNRDRTIISTNAGDRGNAHSEYLGSLSESGILGLITFLLIITIVCYSAIKTYTRLYDYRMKSLLLAALTGLVTYYIHGFLNNFLDTDKLSVPFWGFTAMIVAIDIYSRQNTNKNRTESSLKKA
jgi:putative inorganic carbon (hco3(-)) transporter